MNNDRAVRERRMTFLCPLLLMTRFLGVLPIESQRKSRVCEA